MPVSREEWEKRKWSAAASKPALPARGRIPNSPANYNIAAGISHPPDTSYSLEYAYHLLGDVAGKTVVDYGCGDGENSGARQSRRTSHRSRYFADLIEIAKRRIACEPAR